MAPLRILMLEDNAADAELAAAVLRQAGFPVVTTRVVGRADLLTALDTFRPDVILADHSLPQFTALEAVRLLRARGADLPIILVTGTQPDEVAVGYLREGVDDYVLKSNLARLPAAVGNALQKREAERERAEVETRYRMVSELASDCAYAARVEPDGAMPCEWVTEAVTRLTGYTPAEVAGRDIERLLVHPDARRALAEMRARLLAGASVAGELPIVTKGGEARWVALRSRPVWDDAHHRVVRVYGATRDVTDRQLADAERHRTTELLRAIVESSPSAIVAYDEERRVTIWNPAAERMFGWTAAEVIGKPSPHLPASEVARFAAQWQQVARGEPLRGLEGLRASRSGAVVEVGMSSGALYDSGGRFIGIVTLLADITERKWARRELAERERDLAEAQSIARLGSWVWDMRSGKMRWSDEMYRLLGVPPQERDQTVEGFLAMVHSDDRRRVTEIMLGALRDAASLDFHARIRRRDGAVRIHHALGRVIADAAGGALEMRGTALDVTEQEQARAELEASREELRQLGRRLQEIREEERARISREIHDQLGQTLTALKIDLAWTSRKLRKDQGALRQRNDAIVRLVDSTIDMVRRIAAELRPGLLDDFGLAAAIEWHVHEFAQRTGIAGHVEVAAPAPNVPPEVATALFRILQEALTNVTRHAAAKAVTVRLAEDAGALVLAVQDDGRGPQAATRGSSPSLGILGMQERARALGGDVQVTGAGGGAGGRGTSVVARIPVP